MLPNNEAIHALEATRSGQRDKYHRRLSALNDFDQDTASPGLGRVQPRLTANPATALQKRWDVET